MERLQKVIANSGIASRRKAEELILAGKVRVNGEVVLELGTKVSDTAKIEVNGELISKEDKVYYILNKPRGVITSTKDEHDRKTVVDLIEEDKRIYPVGRLDYDTTGLIILTNDGELANRLMHPKNEIDKVYIAKIKGILNPKELMTLKNGVIIDGVKTSRSRVKTRKFDKQTDTSIVEIVIHEGKNHQVKKMFEAVNHEVLKLKRERVAFLDLTGLKSGEYRKLNPKEVATLYGLTANQNKKNK
ncbi:MAG: rRNA pseudouridine synthase [Bacilli bacterium]|nr:rRNA pseudouridine synthase [Bacilli bacterium]